MKPHERKRADAERRIQRKLNQLIIVGGTKPLRQQTLYLLESLLNICIDAVGADDWIKAQPQPPKDAS